MEKDFSIKKKDKIYLILKQGKMQVKILIILDPGPGSYRSPSDFGHYDGDVVYRNTGAIAYLGRTTDMKSMNSSMRSSRRKL
jgi:hypothetical protein